MLGPGWGDAERDGGIDGPIGVTEHFAGNEDHIGAFAGDDGFGLVGVGDHSDGPGWNLRAAFNAFGEVDLVAGAGGDISFCGGAAATAIDEIEAEWFEAFTKFNTIFECPAAINPIGAGNAHHQRRFIRKSGADGFDEFMMEACAVLEGAAVFVGSLVAEGAQELVEEVSVGGVEFDNLESGFHCAVCCIDELLDEGMDFGFGEFGWRGGGFVERDRAGGVARVGEFGDVATGF